MGSRRRPAGSEAERLEGATHVFQSARAWRGVMHRPIEAQARERRRREGGGARLPTLDRRLLARSLSQEEKSLPKIIAFDSLRPTMLRSP